MTKNKDSLESFQDLFSSDIIDLYAEIKDKLNTHALDLLNQESKTVMADFVKLIFDNVNFEVLEPYEEEEELVDLHN